jgi:cation diffusion facilitator CzcD-associated flavoprotein CzcO
MELNIWTSTTIVGQPTFSPDTRTWTVALTRSDGILRTVHPRHVILASGHSGEPHVPSFPGIENFKGDIHHSSKHPEGARYRGKRVVVVGCCNSAHDIAQDLYEQGAASVTMVQRSSTYVMSQSRGLHHLFKGLYEENGPSTEDADLYFCSVPYPVQKIVQQHITNIIAQDDEEMLRGLEKAGFKVDYGYHGAGFLMKYLLRGGGYYMDVGCSKLISEGKIKIKQGKEIVKLVQDALVFEDGTNMEADLIVLATGYDNMRETARKIFGNQLAAQVSDVWGMNQEGELATIWQSMSHRRRNPY